MRSGDHGVRVCARVARSRSGSLACALFAGALLLAALAPARADESAAALALAREAATEGRRADAIAQLEAHLAASPQDVDARLFFGVVLSWEGRYDDARRELTRVLEQAPDYLDAQIALMNVEWWSGHSDAALTHSRAILSKRAHQPEARLVAQRLAGKEQPSSVALSHTRDWFDDDREPWGETAVSVGRETSHGSVLLRATHAQRFGSSDQLVELEAYPRFRQGSYAYVGFGAATRADLYPSWRLGFDLYQSLPWALELSAGYRRLEFSQPVDIAIASLSKYLGNWMLTARVYHVPGAGQADSTSPFVGVRRYFGESGRSFVGLRYGHGLAREEVRDQADLVDVDSDSLTLELDRELRRRFRFALTTGFSRQSRAAQPDLWQFTLSTTLGVRF